MRVTTPMDRTHTLEMPHTNVSVVVRLQVIGVVCRFTPMVHFLLSHSRSSNTAVT